jgi:GNAT superfamily N-acetyltransferase
MAVETIGDVTIRAARRSEWELLREIAFRAKSHWGYDAEVVRKWASRMDLSDSLSDKREVYVAEIGGPLAGWASLMSKGDVGWLDDLWIEPEWIGKGVGTKMFRHAVSRGHELAAARIELEAERHAIGFYEKMGARYVRDSEPGVWGRISPIMALVLADPPPE